MAKAGLPQKRCGSATRTRTTPAGETASWSTSGCASQVPLALKSLPHLNPALPPLTVREVAAHLSVSEDIVRYLLRTKKLTGLKVGGRWRIPPGSLTDYVVSQLAKQ